MNAAGAAVRRLAADPGHGQRPEGSAQRHADQPVRHPADDDQPVRLPRPGQAVLARAQRRAAPGPAGRAEQLPHGPDQLPAAAAARCRTPRTPSSSRSATTSANMQQQYLTYEIAERNFVLTDPPEGPGVRADHRPPGRGGGARPRRPGGDPDDQPDQLPEPACSRSRTRWSSTWQQYQLARLDPLPRPRHLALSTNGRPSMNFSLQSPQLRRRRRRRRGAGPARAAAARPAPARPARR